MNPLHFSLLMVRLSALSATLKHTFMEHGEMPIRVFLEHMSMNLLHCSLLMVRLSAVSATLKTRVHET